jgi:hypothetical protein
VRGFHHSSHNVQQKSVASLAVTLVLTVGVGAAEERVVAAKLTALGRVDTWQERERDGHWLQKYGGHTAHG